MQYYRQNYLRKVPKQLKPHMKCEICHNSYEELHHIHEQCNGGSNRQDNILAVCHSCHVWIHSLNMSDKGRWYLSKMAKHTNLIYTSVKRKNEI